MTVLQAKVHTVKKLFEIPTFIFVRENKIPFWSGEPSSLRLSLCPNEENIIQLQYMAKGHGKVGNIRKKKVKVKVKSNMVRSCIFSDRVVIVWHKKGRKINNREEEGWE